MQKKVSVLILLVLMPLLMPQLSMSQSYNPDTDLVEGKILAAVEQAKDSMVLEMRKSLAKMNFEFDELAIASAGVSDDEAVAPLLTGLSQIIFQAEVIISELDKNRTATYSETKAKVNEFKTLKAEFDQTLKALE